MVHFKGRQPNLSLVKRVEAVWDDSVTVMTLSWDMKQGEPCCASNNIKNATPCYIVNNPSLK